MLPLFSDEVIHSHKRQNDHFFKVLGVIFKQSTSSTHLSQSIVLSFPPSLDLPQCDPFCIALIEAFIITQWSLLQFSLYTVIRIVAWCFSKTVSSPHYYTVKFTTLTLSSGLILYFVPILCKVSNLQFPECIMYFHALGPFPILQLHSYDLISPSSFRELSLILLHPHTLPKLISPSFSFSFSSPTIPVSWQTRIASSSFLHLPQHLAHRCLNC